MTSLFSRILPHQTRNIRLIIGFFWLFSVSGILAAISFYLFQTTYNTAVIWLLLTLIIGGFASLGGVSAVGNHQEATRPPKLAPFLFLLSTAAFSGLLFFNLNEMNVVNGVRSFWPLMNSASWLLFVGAMFSIIISTLKYPHSNWTLLNWMIGIFVLVSTALIVFPLGYGFDGFIHRATENYIIEHGSISPKPLYYSGQYGLLTFASLLTRIPLDFLDTIALPFLTALFLPLAMFVFGKKAAPQNPIFGFLAIILLPLASFIATTPQGLGNLWVLITGFLIATLNLLNLSKKQFLILATPPIVFTLCLHPISGIPLFIFGVLMFLYQAQKDETLSFIKKTFIGLIAVFGSMALPALFVLRCLMNGEKLHLPNMLNTLFLFKNDLFSLFSNLTSWEHLFLNTSSILSVLNILGLVLLSIIGYKHIKNKHVYLLTTGMILLTYLSLLFLVDFSFLISYETRSYADRLLPILIYLISPMIFVGIIHVIEKMNGSPKFLKTAGVLVLVLFVVSNWFNTYPRDDAFVRNGGFTVSSSDIKTVQAIADTKSSSYVVLANQNIGAAALKTFGFFHYYGSVFAYPIPTVDPLYQIFLEMNENPTRENAIKAADLANTECQKTNCSLEPIKDVFFAVPVWWWQSGKIVETAKTNADHWFVVDDSAVTIFQYQIVH